MEHGSQGAKAHIEEMTQHQVEKRAFAKTRGVSGKAALWQQKSDEHQQKQMTNPFSEWEGATHVQALGKHDENYGKPPPGSKSERRGKQATQLISGEVIELCQIIHDIGTRLYPAAQWAVSFGNLFETYTKISNKLVGMMIRARKHGLIQFEGEILFQRRDDDVVVYLIKVPDQLREHILLKNPDLRTG